MNAFQTKFDPKIHEVVSSIPKGQVLSYGDIARKAGFPRHSRMVSKAMSRSEHELPWHRVVKANYTLAFSADSTMHEKQKELLLEEGCQFLKGKIIPAEAGIEEDLDKLIWGPE